MSATIFIMAITVFIFAWFTNSKGPQTSAFDSQTVPQFDIEVTTSLDNETWTTSDVLAFSDFYCGSKNRQKLFVRITNNEAQSMSLSVRVKEKTEIPFELNIEDETRYYYLGSQIKISEISAQSDEQENIDLVDCVVDPLPFLVKTASEKNGQVNFVTEPADIEAVLPLVTDFVIAGNSTIILTIEFEFADNGTDQSIYQNFKEKGCSSTRLFSVIAERTTGG